MPTLTDDEFHAQWRRGLLLMSSAHDLAFPEDGPPRITEQEYRAKERRGLLTLVGAIEQRFNLGRHAARFQPIHQEDQQLSR